MSTTLTVRLEEMLKNRLSELAEVTHRSRSYLVAEAIREYVASNEWQLQEIKEALEEADAGDFASSAEVNRVFDKWNADSPGS